MHSVCVCLASESWKQHPMKHDSVTNTWKLCLCLPPTIHRYMFGVDDGFEFASDYPTMLIALVRYCPFAQTSHVPPAPVPDSPASHFEHLAEPFTAFSPVPQGLHTAKPVTSVNVLTRRLHRRHS